MSEVEGGTKKTVAMAESQEASLDPGRDCTNPMLNSLVLQTLFKYGSIEEIKTYRQVCRIWNEESLARMRRDGWVRLVSSKSDSNGLYFEDYLDGVNGADAASDPFQFRKLPYNNCKLSNFKNISLVDGDDGRQLEFWSKCGPKMQQLKMSNSCFRSVEDFHAALFRLVPNLKSLKLVDTAIAWSAPGEDEENEIDLNDAPPESVVNSLEELDINTVGMLPGWYWLFRQYPKIKSFRMSTLLTDMPGYVMAPLTVSKGYELEEILEIMAILARDCGISWELEKLDVLFMCGAHFENCQCGLFRHLQLPLTTLCLHIGHFASAEAFKLLLETCANTLRKLVVYREDDRHHEIRQGFPFGVQLDALSELCLTGRGLRPNLDFLPSTPNLKSLILAQDIGTSLLAAGSDVSGHETLGLISSSKMGIGGRASRGAQTVIGGTDFPGLEHLVCSNLEELIISGRDEKVCSSGHVAALCRLMPNLKTVMLGLANDGFRVACEGWKQLEVLIVQPFEVDQIGLTGNDPLQQQRLPNLSDLTGLRYFGMGCETGGTPNTDLSNESVLNAIFPLKNLQGITAVYDEDVDKMSVEIRDQLLSKFPKSKIMKSGDRVREWSWSSSDELDDTEESESSEGDSDDWSDVEENSNSE